MKKTLLFTLACTLLCSMQGLNAQNARKDAPDAKAYRFTPVKEIPVTSVKNQYRSGTCWCFSTLSFLESEVLRLTGKETDLSEMFVVSKSYHDRAVKYVRLDGKLGFSAGSGFGDVFDVIRSYGIVPETAMPGLNYGSDKPEHFEMDAVLKGIVDAVVANPNRKQLTTAWLKAFDAAQAAYLGECPQTFTVDGKEYTPQSYRDALKIKPDDYVSLTSFTHHPFYGSFVIEVCDNWRWDRSYNLPIDELMEVMYNAIDKGYSIAWGSDVSETGFSREGIAVMPVEKREDNGGTDQERWTGKDLADTAKTVPALPEEVTVTQEMRQEAYDRKTTTDDHGMHICGLAKDQNGKTYFIVKNSWGERGAFKGFWYASDAFVRYKTINIAVHKDALPKAIRKKLGL